MEQTTYTVTYGGWYQRTTLHLSEIYDLFARGETSFPQLKTKTREWYLALDLIEVTREAGYLEFVRAKTEDGMEIRYYEDGLYILETQSTDIARAKEQLEKFFTEKLNPAVSYIFSLGAPTPKILANIKTIHPVVVTTFDDHPENFEVDPAYGSVYSKIASKDMIVYKTSGYIFIAATPTLHQEALSLVEMQIFFREFKDQLEKYLHIHRTIWEEISLIKEHKQMKAKEVAGIRSRLDSYQKTISLISNRINQMGSYIRTRSSISKNLEVEEHLRTLFQFKFEVLTDTLDYIKEIWKMTSDYLQSGVSMVVEIQNQSTARGVQSLQFITSIGVISTIIGYLTRSELPKFTHFGAIYFILIIAIATLLNWAVIVVYRNRRYALKSVERIEDI